MAVAVGSTHGDRAASAIAGGQGVRLLVGRRDHQCTRTSGSRPLAVHHGQCAPPGRRPALRRLCDRAILTGHMRSEPASVSTRQYVGSIRWRGIPRTISFASPDGSRPGRAAVRPRPVRRRPAPWTWPSPSGMLAAYPRQSSVPRGTGLWPAQTVPIVLT